MVLGVALCRQTLYGICITTFQTTLKAERKPPLDVPDPQIAFREVGRLSKQMHDSLIFLGLEYINKITGTMKSDANDRFMLLRDSILYRVRTLTYHLGLLQSIKENQLAHLQKLKFNSSERQMALLDGAEQQFGLFDDIVLHSISLFDYVGNLADYVCGTKGRMGLQWNGLVAACRSTDNELSRSPISQFVLNLHEAFVDKLYGHRSQVIHFKSDAGSVQISFSLHTGVSTFTVFAPKKFVKVIEPLSGLTLNNQLTLNYVSFWTVENTIKASSDLARQMVAHIKGHRKTKPGSDLFIFKRNISGDDKGSSGDAPDANAV